MKLQQMVLSLISSIAFVVTPAWASILPPSFDDTVSVLIVKEPGVSQDFVNDQVAVMLEIWNDTQFINGAAAVSLTMINPNAAFTTFFDLDLRGANDMGDLEDLAGPDSVGGYYVALVAETGLNCTGTLAVDTAAHELGHLFGAGHYVANYPLPSSTCGT